MFVRGRCGESRGGARNISLLGGRAGWSRKRPLVTSGRIVVNLDPPVTTDQDLEVWVGGPVEQHRSWILMEGIPGEDETIDVPIAQQLYLSTSPQLLRRMLDPDPPPRSGFGILSGYAGLVVSYSAGSNLPAGPAVILSAGALYLGSLLFGTQGGLARRLLPRSHLQR